VNKTVSALVNDILMPCINLVLPQGRWETWALIVGPVVLKLGDFLSNLIEFVIIALVVYLIAKWILKEQTVTKK
jgi:large conductance mechanosensitive channel